MKRKKQRMPAYLNHLKNKAVRATPFTSHPITGDTLGNESTKMLITDEMMTSQMYNVSGVDMFYTKLYADTVRMLEMKMNTAICEGYYPEDLKCVRATEDKFTLFFKQPMQLTMLDVLSSTLRNLNAWGIKTYFVQLHLENDMVMGIATDGTYLTDNGVNINGHMFEPKMAA